MNKNKLFASVIGLLVFVAGLSAKDYQVAMFGIKSDGVTLNTRSIQRAVDYISEQGGGRLIFYVGRYLTGSIELKSNVTIRIEEGAVLVYLLSAMRLSIINEELVCVCFSDRFISSACRVFPFIYSILIR